MSTRTPSALTRRPRSTTSRPAPAAAESEFDPVPFDAEAARIYGRVTAAVIAAGRKPRGRAVDLMIAATAIAEGLPLYTTSPADFTRLDSLLEVIPATLPPAPAKSQPTISAHKTEFPWY